VPVAAEKLIRLLVKGASRRLLEAPLTVREGFLQHPSPASLQVLDGRRDVAS
jgi:hypothetical protein